MKKDCTLGEGDIIELEEGFFVLDDDLNPMELATEEQIRPRQGEQLDVDLGMQ